MCFNRIFRGKKGGRLTRIKEKKHKERVRVTPKRERDMREDRGEKQIKGM